ncbi:MAG: hypothetical protein ACK452_00465 [Bacteroidota bacterium]|jgi:ABC-type Fe3+ transport system permease subunit
MKFYLLQYVKSAQDSLGGKETANSLVQAASTALLAVSLGAWIVAWRFFRIEKKGKKYFFLNLGLALIYLPFLTWHFFNCYDLNFETGTEHYLMLFFFHSAILVFWSIGFNSKNKIEEGY